MGVHSVAYAFPKVRIITTAVDKEVNDQFHIIPGIGEEVSYSLSDCYCTDSNLVCGYIFGIKVKQQQTINLALQECEGTEVNFTQIC